MSVVMKFSAMVSPNRQYADKFQDAHDFILMVTTHPELDLDSVREILSKIYEDGGKDALKLIRKVRAGEKLVL